MAFHLCRLKHLIVGTHNDIALQAMRAIFLADEANEWSK